jgi:transcriptional regulator with XRE-family HTH domain
MNIGQGIKELRKRCGIYQKDFAKMIGISVNALCSLETNKAEPSTTTLKKIAKTLDIPLSLLLLAFISEEDFPEDKKILYPILKQLMKELCNSTQ